MAVYGLVKQLVDIGQNISIYQQFVRTRSRSPSALFRAYVCAIRIGIAPQAISEELSIARIELAKPFLLRVQFCSHRLFHPPQYHGFHLSPLYQATTRILPALANVLCKFKIPDSAFSYALRKVIRQPLRTNR
jgi:hypothetical protein